MTHRAILLVLLLSLGWAGRSHAQFEGRPSEVFAAHLERTDGRTAGVIAGACAITLQPQAADEQNLIYVLMPLGGRDPIVAQLTPHQGRNVLTNFGELSFKNGSAVVTDNMAGHWTRAMLRDAADWIVKRRLKLYRSYREALTHKAELRCPRPRDRY